MDASAARIAEHMNKDHQLALIDYLVVYGHVVHLDESSPAITNVDLEKVSIDYVSKNRAATFTIKWKDATEDEVIEVKEWSDIKAKLIAMAKYAAHKQGYAHTRLTQVFGPPFAYLIVAYPTLVLLAINSYDPTILPRIFGNDALFLKLVSYLPQAVPSAYSLFVEYSRKIGLVLYALHTIEIFKYTLPVLRKYRASKSVAWKWILMHFVEGFPVIGRLREATH
ncbi:uncharacterized protein CANTADRAFT_44114 [Suhomyces tanzawaensis NRRL Y-17324]|uniref:DUF2470 domain-containing protein n=1 Tax=Suhomyces tanzawaensis NRRL Y-17324 TaxID=984487 RepID=A0A1E4SR84_9ASCO|nr:uncharacterized protein CANTADRAFT_44114 [Suhomyces tanzawaensis NRRL Y-17324]ODV82020.1 hypothetical protein CANTADRAFT_44114 [Suhomyces tanzawaensis NRRL Y-17324]